MQETSDNVSQGQNTYPLPLKEIAPAYEDYYAEKLPPPAHKKGRLIVRVAIALILIVLLTDYWHLLLCKSAIAY